MADKRPLEAGAEITSKKAKSDFGSREYFMSVYDELQKVILEEVLPKYNLPAEVLEWTREMMDYNVPGVLPSSSRLRIIMVEHEAATG